MPDFKVVTTQEIPYFYIQETCSMDPKDIGAAMGRAFQTVWEFLQSNGVATTGKALAVYHTYDPEQMTFQAGFSVAPDAAAKASDPVKFDQTPTGEVLYFQHKGAYSKLRDSYGLMMAYAEQNGLIIGAPAWEIYVNDPATTPEDELLTDVFVMLG
ncbi:GyrI-like domain-containing protein [Labrenzia sp. PHM005]|uniref:GyrI-like domain-containing protein n=1 Tax=Labrenzia sp. PHM005 TaxID=2590016 RepID=UPI00113FE570|nr:GyrI-like domain-containing protein [Labrenzia sp. PHM005]QDG77968.1 GyrI-like domain-containing protein [Labrenzia sp. PHM005]